MQDLLLVILYMENNDLTCSVGATANPDFYHFCYFHAAAICINPEATVA